MNRKTITFVIALLLTVAGIWIAGAAIRTLWGPVAVKLFAGLLFFYFGRNAAKAAEK